MGIPVGVIGASGYAGGELLRLLTGHPVFDLSYAAASGRTHGEQDPALVSVHPSLRAGEADHRMGEGLRLSRVSATEAGRRCAAVFLATPPEVSAALAESLLDAGVEVVIDLSPAFRLRDPGLQRRWYPDVRRRGDHDAVCGLPELNRGALADARLIAMPGCLATAAILALLPLCGLPDLALTGIVIDGKAGSTGSGDRLRRSALHAARSGVVGPYAPAGHRHSAEIREALQARGLTTVGGALRLGMSVFAVNLVRGVSITAHVLQDPAADKTGDVDLTQLFRQAYRDEPFIRIRDWAAEAVPLPDPRIVLGSNYCDVAAFRDADANRLVIIAALDNLIKGAAGQAVQACNIRFGLPEVTGLAALPVYPS
jgi:LysW-gamma-L-alpha-aminoadipyl-6-phosphate/LysW-L-glutamyl-5-phosphate reductase